MPALTLLELDQALYSTLHYLKENWHTMGVGIVAATILDGERRSTATSTCSGDQYIHAERNAVNKFIAEYKEDPSNNAAIVITLSPCVQHMPERAGESCTHLLQEKNIKQIHFGYLDTVHLFTLENYQKLGFTITQTKNSLCMETCNNIVKLFAYPSEIQRDLFSLKKCFPTTFLPLESKPHRFFSHDIKTKESITLPASDDKRRPSILSAL